MSGKILGKKRYWFLAGFISTLAVIIVMVGFIHVLSRNGQVVDESGEPVANALVIGVRSVYERQNISLHGSGTYRCVLVDSAMTNDAGKFLLPEHWVRGRSGWSVESHQLRLHVLGNDIAPVAMGRLGWLMNFDSEPEYVEIEDGPVMVVGKRWDGSMIVTPNLLEDMQLCESQQADLGFAQTAFSEIFQHADLNIEEVYLRKWLNELGLIAMRARFPQEMRESDGEMTNELIRLYLTGRADVARQQSRLRTAIIDNNVDDLTALLKDGIDVNFPDGYLRSRPWLAMEHGSIDAYRELRAFGAKWKTGELDEQLYRSVQRGDEAVSLMLVQDGASGYPAVGDGQHRALTMAARNGMHDIVKAILESSVEDSEDTDQAKALALHEAYRKSQLETFKLLLTHGADPMWPVEQGFDLVAGWLGSRQEYGIAMLEHGLLPEVTKDGGSLLSLAIARNNRQAALAMWSAGFSPAGPEGRSSPMSAAARAAWDEMLRAMLEHPQGQKYSPAWWDAVANSATDNRKTLELLLAPPVDLSNPPRQYACLMCKAAREGKTDIVEWMLASGAEIDARSLNDETALMNAARSGHVTTVRLLLKHGADVRIRQEDGVTAIAMASDGGQLEFMRMVARNTPDMLTDTEVASIHGSGQGGVERESPVTSHSAPRQLSSDVSAIRMQSPSVGRGGSKASSAPTPRASMQLSDSRTVEAVTPPDLGDRPSHQAPNDGMKIQMQTGVIGMSASASPLIKKKGNAEIVRVLHDAGADINAKDNEGWTPLMRAIAAGDESMVMLLKSLGAKEK